MKNLEKRTSIRKYAQREVSNELLHRLLQEAERTQTMGNLQLYSVIVTRSEEQKAALAPAHFNQPMVTGAPVVLTFNFLSFINAATDALLYCQTFCNLADEEGLGYCYLGTTVYMPKQIIEVLQLPRLVFPVATITLGWPDEQPPLSDRLPLESIIHEERYEDYTPERIDRFYTAKEKLPENQEFIRINNKETLAQIFTDIRYTRKDNEAMSQGLLQTLKKQGFLD